MWFDSGMERELLAQSEIEQGIRFGLDHDQFLPYFEPQVDLATGRLMGFEVLARWHHPLTGIIAPDRFIAIAEEHNLIGRLSDQVVRKALAAAADWDPSLTLSINISPRQFTDSWLAQKIVRLLAETGFPAERLVVEVTESSLFGDIDLARTIVEASRTRGSSSRSTISAAASRRCRILAPCRSTRSRSTESFVASIDKNRQSAAIVRAVTTMAQALDVPVVAEGIEDAATHEKLLEMGCALGQGWYFGKPIAAEDVLHLLRQSDETARCDLVRHARRAARITAHVPSRDGRIGAGQRAVVSVVKTALSMRHVDDSSCPCRHSVAAAAARAAYIVDEPRIAGARADDIRLFA